jgi:LysR family hydrogen peroxide-inducible transcriptional activator
MPLDRARPSVRQVEYFVAIAKDSSFRRAAQRLGVSQPTLTNQIVSFEEALGVQLFERSRAGTVLTAVGRELLPNAHRVLEEFQGMVDRADSVSRGPAGTYRLGVTPTLGPYLLPHVLPALHHRYTALKLYVREDAPRDLEAGLADGKHDLILTPLPVADTRLSVAPLFREPLKLVMSSEHRLADRERVDRADLAGESVLTIEEHHHFHQQIQRLCGRLGAQLRRDYEGTSLDSLRHMVVMGMGIAFLPSLYIRSEIHRPRELRVATVGGEAIERTHALAWRSSSPARQLFRDIANEIRSLVGQNLSEDLLPIPESRSKPDPSDGSDGPDEEFPSSA